MFLNQWLKLRHNNKSIQSIWYEDFNVFYDIISTRCKFLHYLWVISVNFKIKKNIHPKPVAKYII